MAGSKNGGQGDKTRLVQMGRNHDEPPTTVNLPVMRASTVL